LVTVVFALAARERLSLLALTGHCRRLPPLRRGIIKLAIVA